MSVSVELIETMAGPMYFVYNGILRDFASEEPSSADNINVNANKYSTTLAAIVSGILKLGRIAKMPEGGQVFRGLAGLALPPEFFAPDEQGFMGGVEVSLMSTTTKKSVAVHYSGAAQGREATIFRLILGKTSIGADVSWLSQFKGEEEMLFPPRTHLQIVGEPTRGADGVSVVTLKPTMFQNIRTVEEAQEWRKAEMKQLAASLVWDLRNKAARKDIYDAGIAARLDALESMLVNVHCTQDTMWYNDNIKYKGAFRNLVRSAADADNQVFDSESYLSKSLARAVRCGGEESDAASTDVAASNHHQPAASAASSNTVAALHSKFTQDLNFKGFRGKFGSDELFAQGIDAVVGPLDPQVREACDDIAYRLPTASVMKADESDMDGSSPAPCTTSTAWVRVPRASLRPGMPAT